MASEETTSELGWVIVRYQGPEIMYWTGNSFSCDNLRALRFARRIDAEEALRLFVKEPACVVEEHQWPHRVAPRWDLPKLHVDDPPAAHAAAAGREDLYLECLHLIDRVMAEWDKPGFSTGNDGPTVALRLIRSVIEDASLHKPLASYRARRRAKLEWLVNPGPPGHRPEDHRSCQQTKSEAETPA